MLFLHIILDPLEAIPFLPASAYLQNCPARQQCPLFESGWHADADAGNPETEIVKLTVPIAIININAMVVLDVFKRSLSITKLTSSNAMEHFI